MSQSVLLSLSMVFLRKPPAVVVVVVVVVEEARDDRESFGVDEDVDASVASVAVAVEKDRLGGFLLVLFALLLAFLSATSKRW